MINKLMALIAKKKQQDGDMSPIHAQAKHHVLKDLMSEMHGMDGDKVKGLKKVTVASNSPEGLATGLDKAKQLATHPDMMDQDSMEHLAKGGIAGEGEMDDEDEIPSDEHDETDMEPIEDDAKGMDGSHDEGHEEEENEIEDSSMNDLNDLEQKLNELHEKIASLRQMQK